MNRIADIWVEGDGGGIVGQVTLSEEEARHFGCAPHCAAGVALSDNDLMRLGISADADICVDVR